MKERSAKRHRRAAGGWARWLGVTLLALLMATAGCDDDSLDEDERRDIKRVLQTGVDLDEDPFVQTETLRVLELIDEPSLAAYAEDLAGRDTPPMVGVAALRVLLRADHDEARRLTQVRFNRADEQEKLAILRVVEKFGPAPLRREITTQGLRSKHDLVRKEAFEAGLLERLHKAKDEGDQSYLDNTLYPELGRHIDLDDPVVSAVALRALVEEGEGDRAKPLLDKLADRSGDDEERLAAARILGKARVEEAIPHFERILDSVDVSDKGRFHVPERIDEDLVRAASLGLIASGQEEYFEQAQRYFNDADSSSEALEVIEAVSSNEASDATIMLEVATQDARRPVRYRAIELLAEHDRAEADDFFSAMRNTDLPTQKRLVDILIDQFDEEYSRLLDESLQDDDARPEALEMLVELTQTDDQIAAIEPVEETLEDLSDLDDERLSALATVLLVKIDGTEERHRAMAKVDDPHALYAYLEHLARHSPEDNFQILRDHFYSDHFALLLMSGAGLLRAFEDSPLEPGDEELPESDAS
ncbi:MAG: HEAT repeat domain-containing protein [Persicimonas sp.]